MRTYRPIGLLAGSLLLLNGKGSAAPDSSPTTATQPAAGQSATSIANASVRYSVPEKAYVVLRRGNLEVVVVDNRKVDDAVLTGHAAGYHGIAALRHTRQPRSLFVPKYAGLNFEHIHDGTIQSREVLFEPRQAPMELRVINEYTAELHQAPTPHWGLESCMRYELLADDIIELTFECIPRRDTFKNGYCGLFWASYIDKPESLDIQFRGVADGRKEQPGWKRGITPAHGTLSTHRSDNDQRVFKHDPAFPLELPFGFSRFRYSEPWYFGVYRGMAFVEMFRPQDHVWLSQSPSGGGTDCPAWDFQWFISQPRIGERYQLKMRAAYVSLDRPSDIDSMREQVLQIVTRSNPR
jgi:hypothetical protein